MNEKANVTAVMVAEHQLILRLIALVEANTAAMEAGRFRDWQFFLDAVDFIRNFADRFHHAKEEDVLFRELVAGGMPQQNSPVAAMLMAHDQGREFVRGLEAAAQQALAGEAGQVPAIAANAKGYAALLRDHIDKEDHILYRWQSASSPRRCGRRCSPTTPRPQPPDWKKSTGSWSSGTRRESRPERCECERWARPSECPGGRAVFGLSFGNVANAGKILEMLVLGPEDGLKVAGGGEDDTVGHRQAQLEAGAGRIQGQRSGQLDKRPLLHQGRGLQRGILAALAQDHIEDLVDGDDRHHQGGGVGQRLGKDCGVRPVGEIVEPGAGIDHVHSRSSSRSTLVSIPRRKPRMAPIFCSGINSMRLP